jgi:hypothetical protein
MESWITPIAQNLIAAAIWAIVAKFSRYESTKRVIGSAKIAGKRMIPTAARIGLDFFVVWFFITQLRLLTSEPSPPNRDEVVAISFWAWWLLWYFVASIYTPLNERLAKSRAARALSMAPGDKLDKI